MENSEGKALDLAALMELNELRRPGVRAIAERLLSQHPEWDAERLAAHAKVQWHLADDERQRERAAAAMPPCPEGGRCTGDLACCVKHMGG
jgi:hypothetical protein